MSSLNSVDLAAARTLLLAYLSNSDNDLVADYASLNLSELCETRRVEDFDSICHVGNYFAEKYDYSIEFISSIREKFEEAEELTWKSFEATMDHTIGHFTDQNSISLFLAVVNSIQVPVEELDDLLDLAAWYASCRLSPLVKVEGGWNRFSRHLESPTPEAKGDQNSPDPSPPPATITMSQLERECTKAVEMGSMIILQQKEKEDDTIQIPLEEQDELTPVQTPFSSQLTKTPDSPETQNLSEEEIETEVETPVNDPDLSVFRENEEINSERPVSESDDGSGTFAFHDRHFDSRDTESISEQSSSERLSSSPVMISPPGTGTPVYITSQPESIDLDSNHSSLDASLINDLIENLKVDGLSDTVPCDTLSDVPGIECSGTSGTDDDVEELAFNRSNTVETIKPVNSSIPIRTRSTDGLDPADDYSPLPSSIVEESVEEESHEGIILKTEESSVDPIPEKRTPLGEINQKTEQIEKEPQVPVKSKPNYLLLVGAAAISVAAIYLKNAR